MTYRPIKRTLKANNVAPEIFAFKFDTDLADGYDETGGVVVESLDIDGYYKCILPKAYTDAQLIYANAEILLDTADSTPGVAARVVSLNPGVLHVATYVDLAETLGVVTGAHVQVLLFLKGGA